MSKKLFYTLAFLLPLFGIKAQTVIDSSFRFYYYDQKLSMFKDNTTINADAVFAGDSITDGGEWAEFFPGKKVLNRGISADNTFGLLNRVDELIARKPKKLFILIGINDLAKSTPPEVILSNLEKLVKQVHSGSPQTTMVLQTLMPTNEAFPDFPKHQHKTAEIMMVNAGIAKLASTTGSILLDLNPVFADSNGQLDKKFTNDGLHLMGSGYQVWVKLIQEKINL